MKSYDHLNSWELPLFNFEHLKILCAWIRHPSEKLWPFEFLESFRCSISSVSIYYAPELDFRVKCYDHLNFKRASFVQLRASQYIIHLNRTSEWKVMTIWVYRELPLFNFKRLDLLCPRIGNLCETLWRLEFSSTFFFNSVRLDILCTLIGHPSEKLWQFEFLESFRC